MDMNKYLEQIEKDLRSLNVSERVDIVREIKSEILELEGEGLTPEEIMARLGSPRDLARGYLGDAIAKGFSWKRLGAALALTVYTGLGGLFLLPITVVSAVAFGICGVLSPVAGIAKFAANCMGRDIPQIQFAFGAYNAEGVPLLLASLLLGALCFAIAWLSWRITVAFVRSVAKKHTL